MEQAMNIASIFAAPVLPASYQEPGKSTASFLTTRAAKWATGIIAGSLAAAVGFMLGSAAVASDAKEPSTPETTPAFVYFPSQYLNTATEIEDLPSQF
ncbi:MAG: hypothetical protein ACREV2_11625 [Burkholderiales bacterium]